MRFIARLSFLLVCVFFLSNTPLHAQSLSPDTQPTEIATALRVGIELEKQRQWLDAIRHYESASKVFPSEGDIKRRLLISRLHYDVIRRSSDQSLSHIMRSVSTNDVLDLYSEVLARLEMSYVDVLPMTEVVRGGTAYLEVALTEPCFVDEFLRGIDRQRLEQFRTSIHRLTLAKPTQNRFDARAVVSKAADLAREQIGLSPSATVMQFVFGAVGLLDPYSSFLSSTELNEVESQIEGNFVGLGIALEPHQVPLHILNVISGGPAQEAGLLSGDQILEIGTVRCTDAGAEKAADLLRGPEFSNVRLLVQRQDGSTFERVISRRRVEVPSIENANIIDKTAGIGYLKISSFQKTTVAELDEALWKLNRLGMQSLILDLRGNPGGWLDASVAVADRFLNDGAIVSTRGKNGIENQNYNANANGTWQVPLVVLIDDQSASASEILAGAIRDNNRGVLVGKTTYGKGSVQGLFHTKTLQCGIRLTVSKFYSPSGRAISDQGVSPTVPVDITDDLGTTYLVSKPDANSRSSIGRDAPIQDKVLAVAIEQAKARALTALRSRN